MKHIVRHEAPSINPDVPKATPAGLLQITEIYASIQGESSFAGMPCVFIRLTGCPLRCKWCDTAYSFEGGDALAVDAVLAKIASFQIPLVELTGGEPLAQKQSFPLIDTLVERGYKVLIETGGSEPIDEVHEAAHIIMDIKCPDSGMEHKNRYENLDSLKASDEIKFVLASRADYDWALALIRKLDLDHKHGVLLSCAFGLLKPAQLAEWMVADAPHCRLNLQQHKYIWHPRAKGV